MCIRTLIQKPLKGSHKYNSLNSGFKRFNTFTSKFAWECGNAVPEVTGLSE